MSDDSELTGNMVTYRISVDRQFFLLRHPEQSTTNDCLALIAELADLRERLEVLREVRDDIEAWGDRAWNNRAAAQATRWSCRLDEVLAAALAAESESGRDGDELAKRGEDARMDAWLIGRGSIPHWSSSTHTETNRKKNPDAGEDEALEWAASSLGTYLASKDFHEDDGSDIGDAWGAILRALRQRARVLEELEEQRERIVAEHDTSTNATDRYWRGVKIGLETAINLYKERDRRHVEEEE